MGNSQPMGTIGSTTLEKKTRHAALDSSVVSTGVTLSDFSLRTKSLLSDNVQGLCFHFQTRFQLDMSISFLNKTYRYRFSTSTGDMLTIITKFLNSLIETARLGLLRY